MADFLKTFIESEDIRASDANSNNQFLLSKLSDNAAQVQNYVEGEVATMKSNIASVQATLQANIDAVNAQLEENLKSRTFVEKSLAVNIGTTDLSSYLPDDGYNYLVWVNAARYTTGSGQSLKAKTDLMTVERTLFHLDGDASRSNRDVFFGNIPVGQGRTVTFTGNKDYLNLCGYSRL